MQRLVFGIAFGQLLAVIFVVLLQLAIFTLFWAMVGSCWSATSRLVQQVSTRFLGWTALHWRARQCS